MGLYWLSLQVTEEKEKQSYFRKVLPISYGWIKWYKN